MGSLAVFVEHFEHPPTEYVVAAIRSVLDKNYPEYRSLVARGHALPDGVDIFQCVMYGMELAQGLMGARPGVVLASSVVPVILQSEDDAHAALQPVVFVAVRNKKGNEWLYPHYLEGSTPSVKTIGLVSEAVEGVQHARGSLNQIPDVSDFKAAATFMHAVTSGVRYTLRRGPGSHILHS